jgi:hypothetical protein
LVGLLAAAAAQSPDPRAAKGDRWAAINSDGTLARGKGATESARVAVGRYTVTFDRKIAQCIYVATIGLTGTSGTADPGTVTTRRAASTKVEVRTFDPTGVAVDSSSFLHVVCQ